MERKIVTTKGEEQLLRSISEPLTLAELQTSDMQYFIDDLLNTAQVAKTEEGWISAGLSAVQIGKLVRIFVVRDFRNNNWSVYVNPELEFLGNAVETRSESCLSIPGVVAEVSRHKRVRMRFITKEGEEKSELFDGFQARIVQHEYDHLDGVLFTDRIASR